MRLELFTTLTTLGTLMDVTVQELRIQSHFRSNQATARSFAETPTGAGN